jgi:hypothetical protein
MADFQTTDVASKVTGPEKLGLADIMGLALSAQAYKQREQTNPLAVRTAKAQAETAETGTKKANFEFTKSMADTAQTEAAGVLNEIKDLPDTPEGRKQAITALMQSKQRMIAKGVDPGTAEIILAPHIQLGSQSVKGLTNNIINALQATQGAQGIAQQNLVGAGSQESLSTNPLTNLQQVAKRDKFGRLITTEVPTTGGPAAGGGGGQAGGNQAFLPSGGMNAEQYNALVGDVLKDVQSAPTKLQDINRGITINDRILGLLNNPKVMTGPFVSALAKGTAGTNLSPEQQEVEKYLAGRLAGMPARSNDQQAVFDKARGSLATSNSALRDIIKSDTADLLADKIKTNKVTKAFGNFEKPNVGSALQAKQELGGYIDQDVLRFLRATGGNENGKPVDVEEYNKYAKLLGEMKQNNPERYKQFIKKYNYLKEHYTPGD